MSDWLCAGAKKALELVAKCAIGPLCRREYFSSDEIAENDCLDFWAKIIVSDLALQSLNQKAAIL